MKNIGIIAEYNPFHNGHLYHLEETKARGKADNIVVVMSGNFVQRGEPAVYDKWIRAEMAIKGGADLVIELPFIFACNNAEYFAEGGVKILDRLNVISGLSFGSEWGSVDKLERLAHFLSYETLDFQESLKKHLSGGLSFPKARYEAVKELTDEKNAGLLNEPNNILAVEYLKQLILQNSSIKALTVKRKGQSHHQSATFIRKTLSESDGALFMPQSTLDVMSSSRQNPVTDCEKLFQMIIYKILSSSTDELSEILSSGEGLEHKLKKSVIHSENYEMLVKSLLSKRYTETRIKRLLIHTLMSLTKEDFFKLRGESNLYGRVLAFSESGAELLRHIKKKELSAIPILTNINKELEKESPMWDVLKYDIVSSDIYNLCYYGSIYSRSDHVMRPFGFYD